MTHSVKFIFAFTFLALSLEATHGWSRGESPPTASGRPRLAISTSPGPTFDLAWIAKIVRVSDPQFAPDGKSLLAVVTRPDYENDLTVAELAAIDVATARFAT